MASGSADVAPPGSTEDTAKAAWVALRNASDAELPRRWGDWAQVRVLARLIGVANEDELLDIIRTKSEFFRLYRGRLPCCWFVMAAPLPCMKWSALRG